MKKSLKNAENAINNLAFSIVKRYDLDEKDSFWIGDSIGGVFCVSDWCLGVEDLFEIVRNEPTYDQLSGWYYNRLDSYEDEKIICYTLKNWKTNH